MVRSVVRSFSCRSGVAPGRRSPAGHRAGPVARQVPTAGRLLGLCGLACMQSILLLREQFDYCQMSTESRFLISLTRHARRPLIRMGRMGPFSRQAQIRRVCWARLRCAAASAVVIAERFSCSSDTSCVLFGEFFKGMDRIPSTLSLDFLPVSWQEDDSFSRSVGRFAMSPRHCACAPPACIYASGGAVLRAVQRLFKSVE